MSTRAGPGAQSPPAMFITPTTVPRISGGVTSNIEAKMLASYIPLKKPHPTKATMTKASEVVAPVRTTKGRPRSSAPPCSAHPPASVAARGQVGAPAAEDRAGEAAGLREEARREAGEGEVLLEVIVHVRRHPEEEDGGDGVGADEGEEERQRGGRGQDRFDRLSGVRRPCRRCPFRLTNEKLQHDAERNPRDTENQERRSPPVMLREEGGDGRAADGAGGDG